MTDQLVSFETAKMAKSKGFDEPCYDAYNERGMQFSNGWLEYIDDNGTEIPFNDNQLKVNDVLLPTQSLLQKWLREVYSIYVTPVVDITTLKCGYEVFKYSDDDSENEIITYDDNSDNWDLTYEESLEKGLQEALKFI